MEEILISDFQGLDDKALIDAVNQSNELHVNFGDFEGQPSLAFLRDHSGVTKLNLFNLPKNWVPDFNQKSLENLTNLQIHFNQAKDNLDNLKVLHKLKSLSMSSFYLNDLDFFEKFKNLRGLSLGGGKFKDFNHLRLEKLEKLALTEISAERLNEAFVETLKSIRFLRMVKIPKLAHLPNFLSFQVLETAMFVMMKDLSSIGGLAKAPMLKNLVINQCPLLKPEHLFKFKDHPTLRTLEYETHSPSKSRKLLEVFPKRVHIGPFNWNQLEAEQ
ncbi:MAG: hypothetical protein ACFCUX_04255 [Candidatus Methylacidiphilales bacterium]